MSAYVARIDYGQPGTPTEDGFRLLFKDDPTRYRLTRVWYAQTGVYGVYRKARWWNRKNKKYPG